MRDWKGSPVSGSFSRRQFLKLGSAAAGGLALSSLDVSWLGPHMPRVGLRSLRAAAPANMYFQRTWERTDQPVLSGMVSRTWMWGPEALTEAMTEPYAESPNGQRVVQYYDKSRMEITDPDGGDPNSIWYVTNGLLVVELIAGQMQVGHTNFESRSPAQVNVAGDLDDPNGPTYATFGSLLNVAPLPLNSTITQRVDRQGNVTNDASLSGQGVTVGLIDDVTSHSIAAPFWAFMNSSGTVYENGNYVQDNLFENAYFATGRPISEPYWADVQVAGTIRLVLVQCFERRVLTYTPGNPPGWLVEAGNVGLHYYTWRYGQVEPPPVDLGEFCVPVPAGYKPKELPGAKLQQLVANGQSPSALTSAFFQMARRYAQGASPANELETAAFAAFAALPSETQDMLECSLEKVDELPQALKDQLFNPAFDLGENAVTPELLATELAMEIVHRTSLSLFGEAECMLEERPGLMRPGPGLDGAIWYAPTIYRVNGLRTIYYGLPAVQYTREELHEFCTLVPIDTTGDGVPDAAQLDCPAQQPPCPGHPIENVCMRVQDVRPGEMVHFTGVNFFGVNAKVRFMIGETVRDVEAHVCGDITTPATETVNGVEQVIRDPRVEDQLTFVVPTDMPSGLYTVHVIIEHELNGMPITETGFAEYLRVVAPPTATFEIASEQLLAVAETAPAGLGSDEVGLRIVAVPFELNGMLGEPLEHKFGGGSAGILDDVDSGESRDITRVLISRNNLAGVAVAIIGFEVDSESAYVEQVQGFIDAFIFVMKSSVQTVANALVTAAVALVGAIIGLSAALIAGIAGAIVAAIILFVAIWAPADRIMEDSFGLSTLDLDVLTSPNYPAPLTVGYTTPGNIDVTVEAFEKIVDYREYRTYASEDEESQYRITLRYSRTT